MTELTNCKNCGAPINKYTCKCEYCGTDYYDGIRDIGKIDKYIMSNPPCLTVNEMRALFGLEPLSDGGFMARKY